MNNIQTQAKNKFALLDKSILKRNGLELDYDLNNPISNLEILNDYTNDYHEFFEDPFVVSLVAKNASVMTYTLKDKECLSLNESEIFNSIVIVNVEKNANAALFIESVASVTNSAILIICEDYSKFELVDLNSVSGQYCVYQYYKESSMGNSILISDSKSVNYSNFKSFLIGRKAEHNFNVFTKNSNSKSYKFITNHFKSSDCKGEIWIDGVLDSGAYSKIIGSINIDLSAGNTDSYMKKEIILLDDNSKLDCVPALEIKTNDVKAGHGVSVSKLDNQKLFYMMSRGLDENTVVNLVIDGLLFKNIDKIQNENVKTSIISYFEC